MMHARHWYRATMLAATRPAQAAQYSVTKPQRVSPYYAERHP
jgi:hypothetical protein